MECKLGLVKLKCSGYSYYRLKAHLLTNEETTTVQLKVSTKKLLDNIGKKGETYDDIVKRLIKKEKASA